MTGWGFCALEEGLTRALEKPLSTTTTYSKTTEQTRKKYRFWRKKVLARVPDPKKQALLAPEKLPHPWGTKRPSLEQNFYEVVSMPHVNIVDINANPIEEVTETGIKLRDWMVVELDVIVFATGLDSVTGGMAQIHILGTHNKTIN